MLEVLQSDFCWCLVAGWRVGTVKYRRVVCRRGRQSLDSLSVVLGGLVDLGKFGELGVFGVEYGSLALEFVCQPPSS